MAIVDNLPKKWRRVVRLVGLNKALYCIDDDYTPDEALEFWGDHVLEKRRE